MNTLSTKKTILFTLTLLFTLSSTGVFAQETERGGGDSIVQEFRAIQYDVLNNIEKWRDQGMLKISDQENQQILDTVKVLEVFSKERVYLRDESNGEPQGQEVTIVNYKFANPPRLEMGRIRWKEISSALARETLVLHELLSVSRIKDNAFEKSYLMKLKTTEKWLNFKADHRAFLNKLQELHTKIAFTMPIAFLATLEASKNTSDYKTCVASEDLSNAEQLEACQGLVTFIQITSKPSPDSAIHHELNQLQENVSSVKANYKKWLSYQPKDWAHISAQLMKTYLDYNYQQVKALDTLGDAESMNKSFELSYGKPSSFVKGLHSFYFFMENQMLFKQNACAKYISLSIQKKVDALNAELATQDL